MEPSSDYELLHPPSDGISSVHFNKYAPGNEKMLLVTSWDKTVRVYNVLSNKCVCKVETKAPLLDGTWDAKSGNECWVAGLLGDIIRIDWVACKEAGVLGSHSAAVKCVLCEPTTGYIISGSWEKSVKIWDPRTSSLLHTVSLPDKVYSMSMSMHDAEGQNYLVVGMAGRHINIYDVSPTVSQASAPPRLLQKRDSSLKYQTRWFVCASIEGRVSVEYFNPDPLVQSKKYAFKCHRSTNAEGIEVVYPVNVVSFHPVYGTFLTGGSDGLVSIWDGAAKKRLKSYPKYPTTISALDFDVRGSTLAIASSYCYEKGEKDHPFDTIYIKQINDVDYKPKA